MCALDILILDRRRRVGVPNGRGKEHVREEDAGGVEAHFRREPVEPSVLLLSAGIPFKFLSFDFVLGGDGSGSSDSDDDVSETP